MGYTFWYTLTTQGDTIVGVCKWDYEEYSMFFSENDDSGREEEEVDSASQPDRHKMVPSSSEKGRKQ